MGEARFVYRTEGVCPSEIKFLLRDGVLAWVRFEGGGCKGNAELICRLVQGRRAEDVVGLGRGIPCRGGTSCPDQLARALEAALGGELAPSAPYRVREVEEPVRAVALVGEVGGDAGALCAALEAARERGVDRILVVGNLTGPAGPPGPVLEAVSASDVWALCGERDWELARSGGPEGLARLPQVISFRLGKRRVVAFQGDYLTGLDGFSDYDPYALEMNMLCGLSGFLEREEVLPALATMTGQFTADAVVYGKPGRWEARRVGEVDFVAVGPVRGPEGVRWGLLEPAGEGVGLDVLDAPADPWGGRPGPQEVP